MVQQQQQYDNSGENQQFDPNQQQCDPNQQHQYDPNCDPHMQQNQHFDPNMHPQAQLPQFENVGSSPQPSHADTTNTSGTPMPNQAMGALTDGGDQQNPNSSNKIFVGGLPKIADEGVIAAYFCNFGGVVAVDLRKDPEGTSRGFAFVQFESPEGVQACLGCYEQHSVLDKWVEVKSYSERKGGTGKFFLSFFLRFH